MKRTIRSQCQGIVLVDFITVMFFLLNILVLSNLLYNLNFKALNIYKTSTYDRELRVIMFVQLQKSIELYLPHYEIPKLCTD